MQTQSSHSFCDLQMCFVSWFEYMFIVGGEMLDFKLQPIPELPGLCYKPIGEDRLGRNV